MGLPREPGPTLSSSASSTPGLSIAGCFTPAWSPRPISTSARRFTPLIVESVLKNPALVGCHWFQYVDEPLTGRAYDGENYNIGFLTVTDTPYPELVAAARAIHRQAYPERAGSE